MIIQIRDILSALFVKGQGIEIGAFHSPWPVGPEAKVTYVDNKDEKTLREAHPDLPPETVISKIDWIDSGITLETFENNSLDFILGSHFLEHTPSIYTTLENHMRKLIPGGLAIYAVPNRDNPIDYKRTTKFTFEHLNNDYLRGADLIDHHHEYLQAVDGIQDSTERERIAKDRLAKGYDIHYHCFSANEWLDAINNWRMGYTIDFFLDAKAETFFVLRKNK